MRTVTLSGTSNSGTILSVGTPDSSTGRRSKSTTSTWNSRSQRELTVNQLSGKLGADHSSPAPDHPAAADSGKPTAPTATPSPTSPGRHPSPPYATCGYHPQ